MMLTRRGTLLGLAAVLAGSRVRFAVAAAETPRRFIVVLLRGALDGLSAVAPYGDPHLRQLRGGLVPAQPGRPGGLMDLGGFYGLDPALGGLHAMYRDGTLLAVHAIAGPYRTRSHFEAQDLLQTGLMQAGGPEASITSGWLNRVVAELSLAKEDAPALAVGMGTPLLLRGEAPVGSFAPDRFAMPSPDLYRRIAALNQPDPLLGPAIARGLKDRHFDQEILNPEGRPERGNGRGYGFAELAQAAGRLLAAPDGPRIAAFELEGWDTHASQAALLHGPLAGLDAGLLALRNSLGGTWQETVVLVITEFGRTARMNGTHGTDHGTATVAFLLGGRIAGGRVSATWPGLGPGRLFQARDLAPTADIRALAKGALAAQFGLSPAALARVFPESGSAEPMTGLMRS